MILLFQVMNLFFLDFNQDVNQLKQVSKLLFQDPNLLFQVVNLLFQVMILLFQVD